MMIFPMQFCYFLSHCSYLVIFALLLQKDIKEKLKPVSVTISYWLEEKNVPVEPVLDAITGTSSTVSADMHKSCGDDNICTPDLNVDSNM